MRTLEQILSDHNVGVDAWSAAVASQLQAALPSTYPLECATAGRVWMLSDGPAAAVRMMLLVSTDRLILASGASGPAGLKWIPLDIISNLDAIDGPDGSVLNYELSLAGGVELGVECDEELVDALVTVLSSVSDAPGEDHGPPAPVSDGPEREREESTRHRQDASDDGEPGGHHLKTADRMVDEPPVHTGGGIPASMPDHSTDGVRSRAVRSAENSPANAPVAGPATGADPASRQAMRAHDTETDSTVVVAGVSNVAAKVEPGAAPIPSLADALYEVDDDPSSLDALPPPSLWEQDVTPPEAMPRARRNAASRLSPWSPVVAPDGESRDAAADLPTLPRRSPGAAFGEADRELEAMKPTATTSVTEPVPAERQEDEGTLDAIAAPAATPSMASGPSIALDELQHPEYLDPLAGPEATPAVFEPQHQWDSPPNGIESVDADAAARPTGITDDWKVWTGDGPTVATPAGFSSVEVDGSVDDFSDLAAAVSSVNDLESLTPERLAVPAPRAVPQRMPSGSVGNWWQRVDGWPDSFRSVTYIGGHPDHTRRRKNVLLTLDDRGIEAVSAGFGSWSLAVDWADVRSIDVEGSDELMFRSNIRIDLSSCAVVIETVQGTLFFECRLRRPASVRSALAAVTYGLASLELSGAQP